MNNAATYTSPTGTTLTVTTAGKAFKTVRVYPATRNTAAETVTKNHRSYSAVERMITKFNFTLGA